MRLTMRERHAVVDATAKRYQVARKKERGRILDEFTKLTKYGRKYAAWLLSNWKRRKVLTIGGVRTVYVFGAKKRRPRGQNPPKRPPTYGQDILRFLKVLWAIAGGLCGKRLAPFIRDTLPVLERFEEISLKPEQRQKLLAISPATIDRLLAPERKRYRLKGRATTRPGSLLKAPDPGPHLRRLGRPAARLHGGRSRRVRTGVFRAPTSSTRSRSPTSPQAGPNWEP